ncbi:bleomycin resistance protein [Clostridium sp.]|uniref:bleomycin resistance protein n=1 Tax=Clostridium sp. TaxID=1506 RepID=UPI002FC82952
MKFNALVPEMSVRDINVSKDFYLNIIGFKLEYERVEDRFAFLSLGEAQLMIEEIGDGWYTGDMDYPLGRGINFQIGVSDVESIYSRVLSAEISLFRDIKVNSYDTSSGVVQDKEFLIQDPDGYLLRFSQQL